MEKKSEPCRIGCHQSDCTYTATGTFDDNGTIDLKILLPSNTYRFGPYIDMTTVVGTNKINALFVQMELQHNDPGNALRRVATDPEVQLQIKREDILAHSSAAAMDFTKNEILIILYHSNVFEVADISSIFRSVEDIYRKVCEKGSYNEPNTEPHSSVEKEPLFSPKKRGMSIILKAK